jgi:hypothetical protein
METMRSEADCDMAIKCCIGDEGIVMQWQVTELEVGSYVW